MPNTDTLSHIFAFMTELDKLKSVYRKTKLSDGSRYENSAEHSWQVCLLALSLAEYADKPIAIDKVIKMLLLHDVVEIDTGDAILYSEAHDNYVAEQAAAKRIFGLLPKHLSQQYLALWEEFEERATDEAQFAYAMDRLMPVLLNLHNNGQSWVEHNITLQQVLEKQKPIGHASQALWKVIERDIIAMFAQL